MKNLIILGSCGSIGTQTLDCVRNNPDKFCVKAISVGRNLELASNIISEFKPEFVCARSKADKDYLANKFPNVLFTEGDKGLIEVACYKENEDYVLVTALVGSSGLKPTYEAIKIKRNVCLANKETLVTAGDIIMPLVREKGVYLYPIDSEHSAIWQCLDHENPKEIKRLIITASGGALRNKSREELIGIKKEDALKHPNWSMGAKITIDSATMINKGFEVIEASHLFNMPVDKIDTVLHKQSIVHSLVEFKDGAIKAELATSDMRIPILYALSYPERLDYDSNLDLIGLNLTFEELSKKRYPLLGLAYDVARKGNIYPTVFNAANEAAVSLFLQDKIEFLDIENIIFEYVEKELPVDNFDLDSIIMVDERIKKEILTKYGGEN